MHAHMYLPCSLSIGTYSARRVTSATDLRLEQGKNVLQRNRKTAMKFSSTCPTHTSAALGHVDSDVVVADTRGRGIDAGELSADVFVVGAASGIQAGAGAALVFRRVSCHGSEQEETQIAVKGEKETRYIDAYSERRQMLFR